MMCKHNSWETEVKVKLYNFCKIQIHNYMAPVEATYLELLTAFCRVCYNSCHCLRSLIIYLIVDQIFIFPWNETKTYKQN